MTKTTAVPLFIALMLAGCATSAPEGGKPTIAPSAEKVGSKPTGVATCDATQEWGHASTDADVQKAVEAHFAQRPNDDVTSIHVLAGPSDAYPNASPDKPVVTYRFVRGGASLVERAIVSRTDGGGWQVTQIAWTCEPKE